MITASHLIADGFFPQELPPPFTTKDLGANLDSLSGNLHGEKVSKLVYFDIPKGKLARRHLSIPNPLQYVKLSQLIENKWDEIQKHFIKSNLSVSKPVLSDSGERALIRDFNFGELTSERALRSTGSRVLLKTDISRYYPSIYTHSIPWALHTKNVAKDERGDSLLGNVLDKHIRNLQDGQTMGIPIGPDISLIISEIIGCELDYLLQLEFPNLKGFRYVDDYYLYFESLAEAEEACAKLTSILKVFELDPNSLKTSITFMPEILEKKWATDLRLYSVRDNESGQKSDIISYFSKSFEYAKEYQSDAVLKYALKKSRAFKITYDNWSLYESLVLRSMLDEPSVLPTAAQILLSYEKAGYELNIPRITETIFELIKYHSKYLHTFEVAWALWLAKSFKITIPEQIAFLIANFENSIVALIALDLRDSNLINGLRTELWETYLAENNLFEEQWLLSYEAQIKGWLRSEEAREGFETTRFFNMLHKKKIQFYDRTATIKTFVPPFLKGGTLTVEALRTQIGNTVNKESETLDDDILAYLESSPYFD